jgi:DNA primase
MTRAGLANAVAPLGTALTEPQLRMLWKLAAEPTLCLDGDQAGTKAAHRALDLARALFELGKSRSFVILPGGQDPDDLLTSDGPEAVRQAVSKGVPLSQVLWERALERNDRATPERRARFETDLETEVERIANPKVRAHYATELRFRVKELFRPSTSRPAQPGVRPGAGGQPALAFRRFRGADRAGKGGGRRFRDLNPWEIAAPPSAELRAASAGAALESAARERRELLIVAALLNHPGLIERHAETLADMALSGAALDSLRCEILDTAALEQGLDAEKLSAHLKRRGQDTVIAEAMATARRMNVWFVLPQAALDDADTGFRQMIALHRKSVMLERDLKAAERLFAEDPSEGNLKRLNEIREELRSASGTEALVDGFGAASGRPSGPVM